MFTWDAGVIVTGMLVFITLTVCTTIGRGWTVAESPPGIYSSSTETPVPLSPGTINRTCGWELIRKLIITNNITTIRSLPYSKIFLSGNCKFDNHTLFFPDCTESISVIRVITVEGHIHCVSWADDGTWLAGPTIFLCIETEGYLNVVISAGGLVL